MKGLTPAEEVLYEQLRTILNDHVSTFRMLVLHAILTGVSEERIRLLMDTALDTFAARVRKDAERLANVGKAPKS